MKWSIVCRVGVAGVALAACPGGTDGPSPIACDQPDVYLCYPELDRQVDGEGDDVQFVSDDLAMCTAGNRIYLSWVDDRDSFDDVWFRASADGGRTWQPEPLKLKRGGGNAAAVDMACIGDAIVVAWQDTRDSQTDYENIYVNYSLDGGETWQAEDIALDEDPEGRAISLAPRVSMYRDRDAGRDRIQVTWFDQVEGAPDVYVAVGTLDRSGLRFEKPSRVSGNPSEPGGYWSGNPRTAVGADGQVHVVWEDRRNASQDIFHTASNANVSEWGEQNRLTVGEEAGEFDGFSPDVCASGSHVHVVWHDTRGGEARDVFMQYSSDGGTTWFQAARRVETDAPGSAESYNARVACDGEVAHVVWADDRDGAYDIYYRKVVAGKVAEAEEEVRLDNGDNPGANISESPVIALRGTTLLVGWTDRRAVGELALTDLYYNYQVLDENGEVTQDWADDEDFRLDSLREGTKYAERLHLDFNEDVVFAAWVDNRDGQGDKDIYFSRSILGEGATQYADIVQPE